MIITKKVAYMNILSLFLSDEDINNSQEIFRIYKDYIPSYRHDRIISSANGKFKAISIYAGLLMAYMINSDTGIRISDINITINEHGKPELHNIPDYHFSLSHSNNHIVCTSSNRPVGIDTEYLRLYNRKLAARYFHKTEYEYLESLEDGMKNTEFTRLWTMKEAYLKMTGTGLSASLDSFCLINNTCSASFRNYTVNDHTISTCTTAGHNRDISIITDINASTVCDSIIHSK